MAFRPRSLTGQRRADQMGQPNIAPESRSKASLAPRAAAGFSVTSFRELNGLARIQVSSGFRLYSHIIAR